MNHIGTASVTFVPNMERFFYCALELEGIFLDNFLFSIVSRSIKVAVNRKLKKLYIFCLTYPVPAEQVQQTRQLPDQRYRNPQLKFSLLFRSQFRYTNSFFINNNTTYFLCKAIALL